MRNCLTVVNPQLPGYGDKISEEESNSLSEKLQEWHASEFAGYRRLIEKGSDCYPDLRKIRALAESKRHGEGGKPIRNFVLMGTGGSSLGSETILRALSSPWSEPSFHFMDNNDPQQFSWLLDSLHPEETLFYVVSKSGKTPETISQFLASIDWAKKKLKGDGWKQHFVICTDPQKGDLRELAKRWELACLDVPTAVGGRFSVLSAVGLFPAAFAGLKIEEFISGALSVAQWEKKNWSENPCALLARALAQSSEERPITVLMPYSSQLSAFSRWFCQLWAESLGKDGKGLTPYPAIGTTDQHSQMQLYMEGPKDKAILLVHIKEFSSSLKLDLPEGTQDLPSFAELGGRSMLQLFEAEFRATRDALTKQNVANATIEIDRLDEYSLGALFYFCEWATAIAGHSLHVNPFDQPGVEAAKILTKKYLGELKI